MPINTAERAACCVCMMISFLEPAWQGFLGRPEGFRREMEHRRHGHLPPPPQLRHFAEGTALADGVSPEYFSVLLTSLAWEGGGGKSWRS